MILLVLLLLLLTTPEVDIGSMCMGVGEEGAVGGVVGAGNPAAVAGAEMSGGTAAGGPVGFGEVVMVVAVVAMLLTPGKMICEPTASSSAFLFLIYSFWSTVEGSPFSSTLICLITAFSCFSLVFNVLYFCTTNEVALYAG